MLQTSAQKACPHLATPLRSCWHSQTAAYNLNSDAARADIYPHHPYVAAQIKLMSCKSEWRSRRKYTYIKPTCKPTPASQPSTQSWNTTFHFAPVSWWKKWWIFMWGVADPSEAPLLAFLHIIEPSITWFTFKLNHLHALIIPLHLEYNQIFLSPTRQKTIMQFAA